MHSQFLHYLLELFRGLALGRAHRQPADHSQDFFSELPNEFGILHGLLKEVEAEHENVLTLRNADDVENSLNDLVGSEILQVGIAVPQEIRQGADGIAHEMLVFCAEDGRKVRYKRSNVIAEPKVTQKVLFVIVTDVADRVDDVLENLLVVAALWVNGGGYGGYNSVLDEVIEELGVVLREVTQQIQRLFADHIVGRS